MTPPIPLPDEPSPLRRFATYFLRGAVITLPVVLTIWVALAAVTWIDGLLGLPIPGVGLLIVILGIGLIGALATNVVTRAAIGTLDAILAKLPLVRLLYTAAKDLMQAFAGEKRRFNRAVRVQPDPTLELWFLGFVTADDMARMGLPGWVAVYLPQSYNIAGNLVLVPTERVVPVEVDAADLMAFIVSGGVAKGGGHPAET
ncbi:MAG: DUF502 domain-containing protein [Gemmatimonadetes bacterium]|nr:DUF502 domain-containing protein [Gemmatimonadota bacterium]MCB9504678.1 DUF502 domain-containing protein [Gemmatimonadales bacterium]MCA9763773.1 DUF502 domain-containing protein [Gemmatimonadota bacterium]MCA9767915.1 DUF502 domain-containing protein [Gemmatimonadota bacterium]HPF61060.1 DUF502 domain-containing protein [Gemmatimonadales bacterium]